MNRRDSLGEALEHVRGNLYNVRTQPNSALFLVGHADIKDLNKADYPNLNLEGKLVSFERSPGGIALPRIMSNLELKAMEINIVEIEAKSRFIAEANGNITVLIGKIKEIPRFLSHHLPAMLSNDRIQSINHIEARQFKMALSGNEHDLEKVQDRILTVLSGHEGIARLFGREGKVMPLSDDAALEKAIDLVGGKPLREAIDNVALARVNYYRALEKMVEHEAAKKAMGWRSDFLPVAVKRFFQKESIRNELSTSEKAYQKADKEALRVRDWLTSDKMTHSIRDEATRLARPPSIIPDASNKGLSKAVELQIDRKIRAEIPQIPQALERAALALNPKKGRGL